MSFKIDERGSKDQRTLYNYLHSIYPQLEIVYEYFIPELGQRVDLYIPSLGIAVEYNGAQHYKFIPHFHSCEEDFFYSLKLDKKKQDFLYNQGVKLIIVPYNKMVTEQELKTLIDNTEYPKDIPFTPFSDVSDSQTSFKESQKQKRKENYTSQKEKYKEDPELKKERLKKEKELRRQQYLKFKESSKK